MFDIKYMFEFFRNPFKILKEKEQDQIRNLNNYNILLEMLLNMFEYEKSEEYKNIDDETIEKCLIMSGMCGFTKIDNKITCGYAVNGGRYNKNGIGNRISINFLDGTCKEVSSNDIYVLGFNNRLKMPDCILWQYADTLSDIELSEKNNIIYTRINPIYRCKNNKVKQALIKLLEGLKIGQVGFISDDYTSLNNDSVIDRVDITDINAISKLQYLSTYHNSIMRRFGNIYGQPITDGMKMAQQTIDEVTSTGNMASIIPLDMLRQREKMCKELNRVFGGNISVKFTKAYEHNLKKGVEENEDKELSSNADNQ